MSRGPGRGSERGPARSSTMAEPSNRLKGAFVLLVGFSGATIALQGDASLLVVALTALGGVVAGAALLWYLLWILG
ncbi:hypothetical protein [Haloterrigena alkaliphila]|uniref:Uncharacterized protein n=1 Tax=Haloterrigena alkaliphila TaxID=2816475 RepID=A0A8A2VGW5_9EURY|nr:hypothetical protein [Haloterrigena alkaliphila]QSW99614.1 hypothetical protein J0X25_01235 [Haloterrigena alkaliphila]